MEWQLRSCNTGLYFELHRIYWQLPGKGQVDKICTSAPSIGKWQIFVKYASHGNASPRQWHMRHCVKNSPSSSQHTVIRAVCLMSFNPQTTWLTIVLCTHVKPLGDQLEKKTHPPSFSSSNSIKESSCYEMQHWHFPQVQMFITQNHIPSFMHRAWIKYCDSICCHVHYSKYKFVGQNECTILKSS